MSEVKYIVLFKESFFLLEGKIFVNPKVKSFLDNVNLVRWSANAWTSEKPMSSPRVIELVKHGTTTVVTCKGIDLLIVD